MKKLIVMMTLILLMMSCNTKSNKQIAQDTSVEYLKQKMKNPESFKILYVETRLDTIPPYLSEKIFKIYEQLQEAYTEANDYIPDYFSQASLLKKKELLQEVVDKGKSCQTAIQECRNNTADVQYLTCIKYNAANAVGGTLSGYTIVITAKEKPDSVLGTYDLENEDFVKRFISLSKEYHGKEKFNENKYGKIDTVGFSFFEKFIIDAMQ